MIFLALYAACALVNIGAIGAGKETARIVSKCCLMPFLAAYYIALTLNAAAANTNIAAAGAAGAGGAPFQMFVVLALASGWAGDAALALKGSRRLFFAGLVCFLTGHIFYILQFLIYTDFLITPACVISLCVLLAAEAAVIVIMRFPRVYIVPFVIYGFALALMASLALQLCLHQAAAAAAAPLAAGAFLFFVSDITLGSFSGRQKPKYADMFIMITYIAAQFCIVRGILNISVI